MEVRFDSNYRKYRAKAVRAFPLASYLLWCMTLLLSNACFKTSSSVTYAILLALVILVFLLILCGFATLKKTSLKATFIQKVYMIGFLFAALSCFVIYACSYLEYTNLLSSMFICLLIAVALFAAVLSYCFHFINGLVPDEIETLLIAMLEGTALFLVVSFLSTVIDQLIITGVLLSLAFMTILLQFRSKRLHQIEQKYDKQLATPEFRKRPNDKIEDEKQPLKELVKIFVRELPLVFLLFLSGFLLAYEMNMMQKTTHFAGILNDALRVGSTAIASIFCLALCILFLSFLFFGIKRMSLSLTGCLTALLIISIYWNLPNMGENRSDFPIPLVLIGSLSLTLVLWVPTLQIRYARKLVKESSRYYTGLLSMVIVVFGGLLGTGLAYLLMMQYETLTYRDEIFSSLPAIIIFAVIVFVVFAFKDIKTLVFENQFAESLDMSNMEDRCKALALQYQLTSRENEVLVQISMGRNIPGVADTLKISPSTAKTHIIHIYRKVGVSSRQELLDILYLE
jgi:DNA-binding CsgD family transcriptional regulator